MVLSATTHITATATGASDHIYLPPVPHVLQITCGTWGVAALQASVDGTNFVDVDENAEVISLTANRVLRVEGGLHYRLNVSSWAANIVVVSTRSELQT